MDSTISIAIIISGFFIGNGIRNGLVCLKNNTQQSEKSIWSLSSLQIDDILQRKLVKKKYLHKWLGIDKQNVDAFISQYPDIPHIHINNKVYYIREELNPWFFSLNNKSKK